MCLAFIRTTDRHFGKIGGQVCTSWTGSCRSWGLRRRSGRPRCSETSRFWPDSPAGPAGWAGQCGTAHQAAATRFAAQGGRTGFPPACKPTSKPTSNISILRRFVLCFFFFLPIKASTFCSLFHLNNPGFVNGDIL